MNSALAQHYPAHVAACMACAETALGKVDADHLLIAAGTLQYRHLDDNPYPFAVNPQFKAWLPVTQAPGSWLAITPGKKPRLVYLQPRDYWHVVPEAPSGYWPAQFDIAVVHSAEEARAALPADAARCAILGPADAAIGDLQPNNPQAVVDELHYQRAFKTAYEVECMRQANRIGARAHRAAAAAFDNGESEFGIQMAYLHAAQQTQEQLPYSNIVALNRHGAVLHYSHFELAPPASSDSFLIDAGASFACYASDITRSYAAPGNDDFQALIEAMHGMQQGLCEMVRAERPYPDIHLAAHAGVATILAEHGIISMSAEGAVDSGLTSHFFPHGIGHGIGAQVHDIGGFMAGPDGGTLDKPAGHPYLRLTRTLAPGMAVTIEPGLYFIDMLLDELKAKPEGKAVNWAKVEALHKFGGIRIEDDVVCTQDEPINLTREAFAELD